VASRTIQRGTSLRRGACKVGPPVRAQSADLVQRIISCPLIGFRIAARSMLAAAKNARPRCRYAVLACVRQLSLICACHHRLGASGRACRAPPVNQRWQQRSLHAAVGACAAPHQDSAVELDFQRQAAVRMSNGHRVFFGPYSRKLVRYPAAAGRWQRSRAFAGSAPRSIQRAFRVLRVSAPIAAAGKSRHPRCRLQMRR